MSDKDRMTQTSQPKATPKIDPSAYVSSSAVLVGDVTIGADTYIAHGAVLVAEGGPVTIGKHCVVMENSVIRGTAHDPCTLGDHVLVGPQCHLTGCRIDDASFIATGASIFNGAHIHTGAEVRINAVVHILTDVEAGGTVPIGWVAVGNPAQYFAADQHEKIWAVQKPLDFPRHVFGVDRTSDGVVEQMTERYSRFLRRLHGSLDS